MWLTTHEKKSAIDAAERLVASKNAITALLHGDSTYEKSLTCDHSFFNSRTNVDWQFGQVVKRTEHFRCNR